MSTATKIIDAAMSLPEDDRSYLAAKLLESLEGSQPDELSPEWREELSRRVREIDEGRSTMIPSTEVWADAAQKSLVGRRSRLAEKETSGLALIIATPPERGDGKNGPPTPSEQDWRAALIDGFEHGTGQQLPGGGSTPERFSIGQHGQTFVFP